MKERLFRILYSYLTLLDLGGGEGGGGDGKCPGRFQLSRTSSIFKQYLPNVALLLKCIGEQDSGKYLRQGYHMLPWQPRLLRHIYSNFDFFNIFLHKLTKNLKQGLIISVKVN